MTEPGKGNQPKNTPAINNNQPSSTNSNANSFQNVNIYQQNTNPGAAIPNLYPYGVQNPYPYYGYAGNYYSFGQQMPNQYGWPSNYQYYNYYNNFNVSVPPASNFSTPNYTSAINRPLVNFTASSTTPNSAMDTLNSQAIMKQNSSVIQTPLKYNVFSKPKVTNPPPKNILELPLNSSNRITVQAPTINKDKTITTSSKPIESDDKYTSLPAEMKRYVKRCFSSCRNSKQKDLMELHLREVIKSAITTKRLHLVNWDKRPLPKFGHEILCNIDEIDYSSDSSSTITKDSPVIKPKSKKSRKKNKDKDSNNRGSGPKDKAKFAKVKEKFVVEMDDKDLRNRINRRQNRFKSNLEGSLATALTAPSSTFILDSKPVVGSSQAVEKPYLRLTSAPDPSTVRPQSILEKSLIFIMKKYKEDSDYHYVCEQFKSIRQDLTIQGIRNEFVVKVYEKHARIALEENDLSEFNQCQNVLRDLYNDGFHGSEFEFLGYRFLYYIYTKSTLDISNTLKEIVFNNKMDEQVSHLVKFYVAWQMKDFKTFFSVYRKHLQFKRFPKLVSFFLDRERAVALKILAKSYFPSVCIEKIIQNMGFIDEDDATAWLVENFEISPDPKTTEKSSTVFNCKNINKILAEKEVL